MQRSGSMRGTEEDNVKEVLGCSLSDARHYLDKFDGDQDRAIQAVLENGHDKDWWGHPSRSTCQSKSKVTGSAFDQVDAESRTSYCTNHSSNNDVEVLQHSSASCESKDASSEESESEDKDKASIHLSGLHPHGTMFKTHAAYMDRPLLEEIIHPEELKDDRAFYGHYGQLVDSFLDLVCCKETHKGELKVFVLKVDAIVTNDSGSLSPGASNLVNRLSFAHKKGGRTPLTYAVAKNLKQMVYDLIDLGAEVSKEMPTDKDGCPNLTTALVIAATNKKRDGTDMVRILLSKGANPLELKSAEVDIKSLGRGMKYWIIKALRVGVPAQSELLHLKHTPPMDRIHELDYAVVGEEAAISVIQEALAGRFGNPQGNSKPLVMLLLGPPGKKTDAYTWSQPQSPTGFHVAYIVTGHGKTYLSSNAAHTLVGKENFLFVPCQSIRDDADLFGSRLGGSRGGEYSSDGQLTKWLRLRQKKKCIVFLDEFEKMQSLTSALGWDQAKKIYQSFLEPWNDGTLSDQGASSSSGGGSNKIDCSQCVWIMTANWGQQKIIDFYEKNRGKMNKKIDHTDVTWIQKELVSKVLRPLCIREFGAVHEDIKALCRRIDAIVPFLPFTPNERKVVADIALTERFSLYREPCVLKGPEEKRRSLGNLHLHGTRAFNLYAAGAYDPLQGASAMLAAVQKADGKFQMMNVKNQLDLTKDQKARMRSPLPPDGNSIAEPNFWVHYDNDSEILGSLNSVQLTMMITASAAMTLGKVKALGPVPKIDSADGVDAKDASPSVGDENTSNTARSGAADSAF